MDRGHFFAVVWVVWRYEPPKMALQRDIAKVSQAVSGSVDLAGLMIPESSGGHGRNL